MFQLNEIDQQLLLKIARQTVFAYLNGSSHQPPEIVNGILSEPHGVFVSIHRSSSLRGCIGNIHPVSPLYRTTSDCAVSAAVGDPRFAPLTLRELTDVDFEISVLSPLERVEDINAVQIGRDGVLVTKKAASGLLLPQVAASFGWNREQFLSEACIKAGLRREEWKDGAMIYRFAAHVFQEEAPTRRT